MTDKKPRLDPATVAVAKRVLAMPPKQNAELKVGRAGGPKKKDGDAKGPAFSAKRHSASRTDRD